ncbi:hypothetical protein MLD38_017782 [Melastoma candidum]|uniref:Uncharacterized protein n=1 Tax=Melastoma candidum TaxID=119954 RepID=A0ACB9QVU6_9MYRT|nr:hypothetical protein MLD38_017782 [Melastoma candidum]
MAAAARLLNGIRSRRLSSSSSYSFAAILRPLPPTPARGPPGVLLLTPRLVRSFAFGSVSDDGDGEFRSEVLTLPTELLSHGVDGGGGGGDVFLPVKLAVSFLDSYHDLTGLPWWFVISSSTLAMRVALLPMLVLQLRKIKRISELFPKLPPPLPPPFSGRSYIKQLSLFRSERRAAGCPSFFWFLSSFSVQVPCFLLWMTTIRRMSLDHHPGFDSGGIFWFQNLCEIPSGTLGLVLPLLISALHFINVQVSFARSDVREVSGLFGILAKFYRWYLEALSFPLIFIACSIPQGSLVYWVTNSSLTLAQQVALKDPAVRGKLGLGMKQSSEALPKTREMVTSKLESSILNYKHESISPENMSPRELHNLSVILMSNGQFDQAAQLLQLAIEKDPDNINAMIELGVALFKKEEEADASKYFEHAIAKIFLAANLTEAEYRDLLILASEWAGITYMSQGKESEGIVHLKRIASMDEPEEPNIKSRYYGGLVLLASALYRQGSKAEAAKYLRMAVAYDPSYSNLLKQCEQDDTELVDGLVNSRRGNY